MARKKSMDGVVATIERLTNETPCPLHLRNTLNKYLYQEHLFEGARPGGRSGKARKLGQLRGPDTDNLVRNLLDLDALFFGETNTVIDIVTGEMKASDLHDKLDNVERSMRQRLAIYGYWLDRISSARAALADPTTNLRVDRLDEKLSVASRAGAQNIPPFALQALRVQEASEAQARRGPPSASDYVERADAYLALGDLVNADRNACLAIEVDPASSRAWFIRVAVGLRRRRSAMRSFHQKRMEAQECAEPLSAHEQWALEEADEAAGDAWEHQRALDAILPQAILHWPMEGTRRAHNNLWRQVRDLFVARMFSIAVHDVLRAGAWRQWASLNGLEPEWELEQQKHPYLPSTESTENSPFTAEDTHAISNLLVAYDDKPREFFEFLEDGRIATDFRLFHLRYVLRMGGCDAHWARLRTSVAQSPLEWQADHLMNDPSIAKLWQLHWCRQGDSPALMQSYTNWFRKTQAHNDGRSRHLLLRQYAYLFHYQFARRQFDLCGEAAASALALYEGAEKLDAWFGDVRHPYDASIGMPLHHVVYWEYLAAIAAVEQRRQGGALSQQAQAILAHADRWRARFSKHPQCFWTASEEYEGGGGEDWPEPPYGIDLRLADSWAEEAHAVPID
ncbi:hypothetical protein [Massilia sp. H6]|uniref:hypothetical protein n=1 Tax=Massilia sp. H6 TaxID=2970464 RepID=UPI002169F30A|nr:hypothetical protein [Massilia sp. H6]UVW30665.1 hypothetical protein NRS07_20085 [Massilia sp. H6]